jgi:8-oxo-dGTP pyrophosphatase MutT (NUDIX family)
MPSAGILIWQPGQRADNMVILPRVLRRYKDRESLVAIERRIGAYDGWVEPIRALEYEIDWVPSKGSFDEGQDWLPEAERETYEETGISVDAIANGEYPGVKLLGVLQCDEPFPYSSMSGRPSELHLAVAVVDNIQGLRPYLKSTANSPSGEYITTTLRQELESELSPETLADFVLWKIWREEAPLSLLETHLPLLGWNDKKAKAELLPMIEAQGIGPMLDTISAEWGNGFLSELMQLHWGSEEFLQKLLQARGLPDENAIRHRLNTMAWEANGGNPEGEGAQVFSRIKWPKFVKGADRQPEQLYAALLQLQAADTDEKLQEFVLASPRNHEIVKRFLKHITADLQLDDKDAIKLDTNVWPGRWVLEEAGVIESTAIYNTALRASSSWALYDEKADMSPSLYERTKRYVISLNGENMWEKHKGVPPRTGQQQAVTQAIAVARNVSTLAGLINRRDAATARMMLEDHGITASLSPHYPADERFSAAAERAREIVQASRQGQVPGR